MGQPLKQPFEAGRRFILWQKTAGKSDIYEVNGRALSPI